MSARTLTCAGIVMIAAVLVLGALMPAGSAGEGRAPDRAGAKTMVMWLHYDPTSPTVNGKATQLTFNTSMYWTKTNYTIDGDKNLQMDFYMVPPLAAAVTVEGTVTVGFWGNYSGSNNNFQTAVQVSERSSSGSENWSSTTYNFNYNPASAPQYYSFDCTNFQHTFATGSTIHLNIQVSGGSGIYKAVYIDTVTNNSRLILPCNDYMEAASINTFDYLGNPKAGFQTNEQNTTVIMRATVNAPFGGYDVRWSNLTLQGPAGTKILDNASMTKVEGTPVSFANTYEASWNYSGAAPGRYNITVFALDNNGYYYCFYFMNYNYGSYLVTNTSFFFIGSPRFINVQAVDSTGVPLDGAEVRSTVLSQVIASNLTNRTGHANLTMQPGPYRFVVMWRGVPVSDEPVDVTDNRTADDPLVIRCWVYYPAFRALDSRLLPLVDAAIYIHYPNGTASILPFRTDQSGTIDLVQAPRGPYALSVVWGGLEVNRTVIIADGNLTYDVNCAVYYLLVKAVDPHGAPVPSAQVAIYYNTTGILADSRLTGPDGSVEFRLPRHLYDITVHWYEAVVFQGRAEPLLDGDRELTVVCGIFYLTVRSVDSAWVPLENALAVVSIGASSKVLDTRLSDGDGEVTVKAPAGLYNITVSWQDITVFEGTGIEVQADSTYTARCNVFYLTVTAVDAKGVPVENVQVLAVSVQTGKLLDSRTSGPDGSLISRLPAAELALAARWQDVVVNTTPSYMLAGNGTLELRCSIFYLTVEALDSRGVPVQAVQVKSSLVSSQKLLDVQSTDGSGRCVSRLPGAEISIQAFWQDALVNTTPSYYLAGDGNGEAFLTLECRVYYLEVVAVDSRAVALEDAFVTVYLATGRQLETRLSDDNGSVTVRVPVGPVDVTVTWSDVVVAVVSGHEVAEDHRLTVGCSVYYLDVTITDSQDRTVSNAQVTFKRLSTRKTMGTLTTGFHGTATFRLPAEGYNVTVIWQDQLVSPVTRITLSQDGNLTVKCLIFYLTAKPVDSKGLPLENATVVFRQELTGNILDTQVTGKDGIVTARLPVGLHTIVVSWKDVEVSTTTGYDLQADVPQTNPLIINCRVFYLTVNPKDVDGVPLSDAEVLVYPAGQPDLLSSNTTNYLGQAVFRLPAQGYDIRVSWRAVEVCTSGGYALVADALLPLDCKVYYLTVRVVDRDGNGLEGVQLTVFSLKNGLAMDVMDSAATNGTARHVFRLPVGEYRVGARLKTTYLLTPIDMGTSRTVSLQQSMSLKLAFSQYPVPFYTTNAFFVALLVVLLIIMAATMVYYVYRKFGRRGAAAAGEPEGGEEEGGAAPGETEEERHEGEDEEPGDEKVADGEPEDREGGDEETGDREAEDKEAEDRESREEEAEDEAGPDKGEKLDIGAPQKAPAAPAAPPAPKTPASPAAPAAPPTSTQAQKPPAKATEDGKDVVEAIDDILKGLDE